MRNLVGRHVHLREMGVLGRWWYEWPEAADPGTWKSAPVKKRYRLNKQSFALYKSASEHIKPIRSIPPALILLGLAVVGLGVGGWMTYSAISTKFEPPPSTSDRPAAPSSSRLSGVITQASPAAPINGATIAVSFMPRLSDQPETAPAYDHLRKVVSMPRVVGGFCIGQDCQCQTQQGTQAEISDEACRAWVARRPFDPYRLDAKPVDPGSQQGNPATRQEQEGLVATSAPL